MANSTPVIGVLEEFEYRNQKIDIDSSDTLIAYTDGLIEARRDSEFFGEDRLLRLVAELQSTDVAELPRAIYDQVLNFANGELLDDVAILALSAK